MHSRLQRPAPGQCGGAATARAQAPGSCLLPYRQAHLQSVPVNLSPPHLHLQVQHVEAGDAVGAHVPACATHALVAAAATSRARVRRGGVSALPSATARLARTSTACKECMAQRPGCSKTAKPAGAHLQKASGPSPVRMITPIAGSSRASEKHHDISSTAGSSAGCVAGGSDERTWVAAGKMRRFNCKAQRQQLCGPPIAAPVRGVKALRFSGLLMVICGVWAVSHLLDVGALQSSELLASQARRRRCRHPPWRCPPPGPSRSALPSAAPWPPCQCAASALGRGRRRRAPAHSCWAPRWPRRSWCWLPATPRPCRRAAAAPPRLRAPPHLRPARPGAGTAPSVFGTP